MLGTWDCGLDNHTIYPSIRSLYNMFNYDGHNISINGIHQYIYHSYEYAKEMDLMKN